jgi:hypothetical protein
MSSVSQGGRSLGICFNPHEFRAQQANQARAFHALDSQTAARFARGLFAALGEKTMKNTHLSPSMLFACVAICMCAIGCVSPEQQRQREADRAAQRERDHQALLDRVRAQCREFGYQPQTDAFASCVQTETRNAQSRAESQAQRNKLVAACKQAMWLRPTRSGSFAESAANVELCDSDPQAHLRPVPPSYNCSRNTDGSSTCNPH